MRRLDYFIFPSGINFVKIVILPKMQDKKTRNAIPGFVLFVKNSLNFFSQELNSLEFIAAFIIFTYFPVEVGN